MIQIDLATSSNYCGIYAIKNNLNDKLYVGGGKMAVKRLRAHVSDLRRQCHHNKHLQAAWLRYGENSFSFHQIETCQEDCLIEREQFWIDATQQFSECGENITGYNILSVAGRPLFHKWPISSVENLLQKNRLKAVERLKVILQRYTPETVPLIRKASEILQEKKDREWITRYRCAKNGTSKIKWIPELETIARSFGFDLFIPYCNIKTISRLKQIKCRRQKPSLYSKDTKERSDARFLRGLLDAKNGRGKYVLNEATTKLLLEITGGQWQ